MTIDPHRVQILKLHKTWANHFPEDVACVDFLSEIAKRLAAFCGAKCLLLAHRDMWP